jgi:hypothetical protein
MNKKRFPLWPILILLLVTTLVPISAFGTQLELDQAQEKTDYGFWLDETVVRGQEFRPFYNSLSQVDIFIRKDGRPGDLQVAIKNSSGEIVWNTTVSAFNVPAYGWLELPIEPSLPVTPHSSMTIAVASSLPSPNVANRFYWLGSNESEYVRGESSLKESWPDYDFAFRIQSDTSVVGQACFIYADDREGAESFKHLLEANGYPTTLVPLAEVVDTDFSSCALIIVGHDTGNGYDWGTPTAVTTVHTSGKAILGLGFGGSSLMGELGLSINWGNGWVGAQTSILAVSPENTFYREPYSIDIGSDGIVQLYNAATSYIGEYAPLLGDDVVLLGREVANNNHYPLVQEGRNLLWGFSGAPADMTTAGKKLLLNTVHRLAVPEPPLLYLSLNIEDAPEGVPVNKLTADSDGPTHFTRLEIISKLFNFTAAATRDLPVVLKIKNDLLGAPTAFVRDTDGGDLTSIPCVNLGEGRYRVITDLTTVFPFPWMPSFYHKQIVWKFLIPNTLTPQDIAVTTELEISAIDPESSGIVRILAPGTAQAITIANRKLLYEKYADNEVSALLQKLFSEAQGAPASHSPLGVVYYVDRYDVRAAFWDNSTINYSSTTSANITAAAIDTLIEDWQDDATSHIDLYTPFGPITIPLSRPKYLLVAGGDDTIPFYRYDDPYNEESDWSVNSTTNPAVRATDHDFFLTDNPYADLGGGTDWQTGDLELWNGRLLGESAADMLSLLTEGTDWQNGRQGGAVLASVAGWEMGLEDDDGRSGEITDLTDVTALLRNKGFAVRNDNTPIAEVRSIDVMAPYEGGDSSWNTNFINAANNAGGMDIFLIGGHDSYDHAVIPGDNFSPDDTPSDYTRFGSDHPLAMIIGCHGGLPVADIDIPGGIDHSMVYDLVHEGVKAYIGATGFSYGSPSNLHKCTWGERLIQRFFLNLTAPAGSNSMSFGKALSEAKQDYTFGLVANRDALDRKTVTEFNLYGVPWSFIFYPEAMERSFAGAPETENLPGEIRAAGDEGIYTQTVEFAVPDYQVQQENQNGIDYDIFSIKGADTAISPDTPILPFIKLFSLPLPPEAEIINVKLVEASPVWIGHYNIPTALIKAFSEGGISYTMDTDIDFPFPDNEELVQYQKTGDGILITLFPVQHNPKTDETWFYPSGSLQVTYRAPQTLAVTDFSTERDRYLPQDRVATRCVLSNVGEIDTRVNAILQVKDRFGKIIGEESELFCEVSAGGSYDLNLDTELDSNIPDGPCRAEILIRNLEKVAVAGASTDFSVVSGEITGLSTPKYLACGETGTFRVTFANHKPMAVTGRVSLNIQDNNGSTIAKLAPINLEVDANAAAETVLTWVPHGFSAGTYTAAVVIEVNDNEYGPVTGPFFVADNQCQANLDGDMDVDGYDLSVFTFEYRLEGSTPPNPADLNGDGQVDTTDIANFAERFGKFDCGCR